jgi:D-alanyl-D-alanine carboxypeptidase
MCRVIRYITRFLMSVLVIVLLSVGCTLDVNEPLEPTPETWDPALNTHPHGTQLQDLLKQYVREGLPGVVLLVRTPQGQWNGSAGYSKIEKDSPMLPTHRHHAASVTKMYTATAVLLLAEEGVVDLDARICNYLPEAVWKPIPNGGKATVRQLLGHTSGIPDFNGAIGYDLDFLNDPMGSYPPGRLLSYLHGQSAICVPGTGYFYSNANYLLLALIMDHVTEASHANVVSMRILQPLGLNATYYKNEPNYPRPLGIVNSYQDLAGDGRLMNVSDLVAHNAGIFFGNAGLIATSADFAEFIEALLDGRIVNQESLAQMQRWRESSHNGLGLNFIETPYGVGIGHSGGDLGIMSQVRHFPGLDATLVLLVNGGDSGVISKLFNRLWDDAMRIALAGL